MVRESIRLKSVIPLTPIEPLTDTTICGVRIAAGTRLLLLLRYGGLGDRSLSEFDPDRWLDTDRAPKLLAFGAGPRFCPGRNLAILEAKTAVAMIARNFVVELEGLKGPVTERFGFTLIPHGLRVRLREREPAGEPIPER